MPIFEFECQSCGKEFETILPRDFTEVNCPACDGNEVKKLLSLFGFRSKGSGADMGASGSSSSSCSSCTSTACSSCSSH